MGDNIISGIVTIASAVVGIAIIAVLVGSNSQTSNVIQAATSGFANDIKAAVSPASGGGFGNFTGGGVGTSSLF